MKVLSIAALTLLLGVFSGGKAMADEASPAASRPSLAILPLKEEGRKDLGDVSETMNMLVANAFEGSGFRVVARSQVAALPADQLQGLAAADPGAVTALGARLGARFILTGSYLPEYSLANSAVTVTVSLRMLDTGDGTVFRNFQETGTGASMGGVVALLTRQLSAKAAAAGAAGSARPPVAAVLPQAAPAPAPALPAATMAAAVPVPVPPAPAAAVVPAPTAPAVPAPPAPAAVPVTPAPAVAAVSAPASVAVPAPPAPAAVPVTPTPAVAAVSAPAATPDLRKAPKALLVLRGGQTNGIYYGNSDLNLLGARLEDFDFLLKSLAGLFPANVAVTFDIGSKGAGGDAALNRALVAKYQPDILVVLTLDCTTRSQQHLLLLSKQLVQVEARVDFIAPDTLALIGARSFQSDFLPAKGIAKAVPPELKDQLASRMAAAIPSLPY